MKTIKLRLDVPLADADDARRRRLLNILLFSIVSITLLGMLAAFITSLIGAESNPTRLYGAGFLTLAGIVVIFLINRYWLGEVASSLFLSLVTIAFAFDEAQQVVEGRTLFLFVIPILMSSVLLRPYASFITTGLITVLLTAIALNAQLVPNAIAMLGFVAIATVSWLSARSLEQALQDLRLLNEQLEQRVTDRTHDLAEALGKNQAILEGIADGVIVFDNSGKASVVNPAISQLLNWSTEEIINHDIKTLMKDHVDAAEQETVIALLKNRDQYQPSIKLQWDRKTLSVSFAPVRAAPGEVTGTVAVFRDFTKEAEVDRMKSAIVSMVSHDLRTPLNAVLGYAEMLEEAVYGPLSDKQQSTMARITANAKRLLSLINDLLDQAQIEAGKISLKITSFTPAELIEGVQSVMDVLAQHKELELTSHIADDVPATLQGDPQRLHQIMINLVGNALKFTEQGSVHMRVYRPDAAHWALQVIDTGPGIPADKMNRVFERFYQVDDLTTRKHQGVGLGLSIVKQLVTLMDGQVSVDSEVGKGSAFTAVLPLVPPQKEKAS